jgi:hypothetical protein
MDQEASIGPKPCSNPSTRTIDMENTSLQPLGLRNTTSEGQKANIAKPHETMPLDAATIASTARGRNVAFTSCNIKSSWLKIGPYPFNPDRVLQAIQKPQTEEAISQTTHPSTHPLKDDLLPTPMAVGSLTLLHTELEQEIHVVRQCQVIDSTPLVLVSTLANE